MTPYRELAATVRRQDKRRAYLESHVFELLIGLLTIFAAAAFFLEPGALERSAVGRAVPPFDVAWNALYAAGGILVVAGLTRPSYRLELAGLCFLAAALGGATAALVVVRGLEAAGSLGIHSAAAVACLVRIHAIRRINRAVAEVDAELLRLQEHHPRRRRLGDR